MALPSEIRHYVKFEAVATAKKERFLIFEKVKLYFNNNNEDCVSPKQLEENFLLFPSLYPINAELLSSQEFKVIKKSTTVFSAYRIPTEIKVVKLADGIKKVNSGETIDHGKGDYVVFTPHTIRSVIVNGKVFDDSFVPCTE